MTPYQAYVLRLWSEIQEGETVWRFALLDPQSGKRVGFVTLSALFDHLLKLTQDDNVNSPGEV